MKKLIFTITIISTLVLAIPASAATTLSLTPGNISVKQEQTFTVTVALNPQGAKNYTAKVELKFPANLMEVKTFTFGNNWLALSQSGYNLVDNTNGILIKSAGYAGGVSSPITFGTVSFLAKKSGSGVIEVGNSSLVLDASSQDVLSDAAVKASVVIAPKIVAQVPIPTPKASPSPVVLEGTPTPTPSPEPGIEENGTTEQETPQPTPEPTLFATIGTIISLGTNNLFVGILVVVAVLLAIYFIQRARKQKRKI